MVRVRIEKYEGRRSLVRDDGWRSSWNDGETDKASLFATLARWQPAMIRKVELRNADNRVNAQSGLQSSGRCRMRCGRLSGMLHAAGCRLFRVRKIEFEIFWRDAVFGRPANCQHVNVVAVDRKECSIAGA